MPAPRAEVFSGQPLPDVIAEREQESTQKIKNVLCRLEKKKIDLSIFEKGITKAQRLFRAKKRRQEDIQRVSTRYNIKTEEAKQLLKDANTPYIPKCNFKLAQLIMEGAAKVKLFSIVKHLTAEPALGNIFDNGLYGRRTLLQFYLTFKPASLWSFDIEEGDGNVICLGANTIDPGARHGIELEFDAEKVAENNPCVFFKQRDLGYRLERIRDVKIGELNLFFSHTDSFDESTLNQKKQKQKGTSAFQLFNDNNSKETYAYATVKNTLLVAYDIEKMHQILALNFFRFIDNLHDKNFNELNDIKQKIYSELAKLDNEELLETLQQIGNKMTDTMEFNFYGAYKVDFSTLINIKSDKLDYTLHLPTFVDELRKGCVSALDEAKKSIPTLFNSHRFIDFLLSNTEDKTVVAVLSELREKCTIPAWMPRKQTLG